MNALDGLASVACTLQNAVIAGGKDERFQNDHIHDTSAKATAQSEPVPPDVNGGRKRRIWSLLIGIEEYADNDTVLGALQDVHNMYNYLIGCDVDDNCIKILRNEEARRQTILDVWESHLIDNHAIEHEDPILIYYSGHGAHDDPPEDWLMAGSRDMVEMLVAYDSLALEDSQPEFAIPDRTIGALIRRTAKRHSDNITLILDCCHSAHMSRSGQLPAQYRFLPRAVLFDPEGVVRRIKKLTSDVDRHIWGHDAAARKEKAVQGHQRGAVTFAREDDTHVLLAGCARREESMGGVDGGLFTRALLSSLAETEVISYDRLLTRIHEHYRRIYAEANKMLEDYAAEHDIKLLDSHRPGRQTPQCEGVNRNRLLWQKEIDTTNSFPVQPYEPASDGTPRCRIYVSAATGVKVGTVFQLHQAASSGYDTNLASVIATEAGPSWCIANVPLDISISSGSVRAIITTLGGPLKCWVENAEAASPVAVNTTECIRQSIEKGNRRTRASAVLAESSEAADVVLLVNSQGVLVDRRDYTLRHLELDLPFVKAADIRDYFPSAFPALARFHDFISLENTARPFADLVDVRLHELPVQDVYDSYSDFLEAGPAVPIINNEMTLPSDSYLEYAFVLTNHSDIPLFPYVMWMDPASCEVSTFWSPLNDDDAPLPARRWISDKDNAEDKGTLTEAKANDPQEIGYWLPGSLQLGRSTECPHPLSLQLMPGLTRDTGVIKIFLAEKAMKLSDMEQGKIFGYTEDGTPNMYASGNEAETRGGEALVESWDSVTKLITVVRNKEKLEA